MVIEGMMIVSESLDDGRKYRLGNVRANSITISEIIDYGMRVSRISSDLRVHGFEVDLQSCTPPDWVRIPPQNPISSIAPCQFYLHLLAQGLF